MKIDESVKIPIQFTLHSKNAQEDTQIFIVGSDATVRETSWGFM